jgi:hypothetical protein
MLFGKGIDDLAASYGQSGGIHPDDKAITRQSQDRRLETHCANAFSPG